MAGHVYASVSDLSKFIVDGGNVGTTNDALMLTTLGSVSRMIDAKAERSAFGSGFGPRIGTNRYDGSGGSCLRLRDDLIAVTSFTIRGSTGSASTQSPVADTDYYLTDGQDYVSPYREVIFHRQGISAFGSGYRVTDIAGKWGYQDVRVTSSATTNEAMDTSETGMDVSSGTAFSPGQTLLVDAEQMLVTSIATNTLTVVRAVNGTTAATHLTAAPIDVYQYPDDVKDTCIRLALRRWRARDGGADGFDGGLDMASTTPREGEDKILARGLYSVRLKEMT